MGYKFSRNATTLENIFDFVQNFTFLQKNIDFYIL